MAMGAEAFDFGAHTIALTRDAMPTCAVCGEKAARCACDNNTVWRDGATPERADTLIDPSEPFIAYCDGSGTVFDKPCGWGVVVIRRGVVIAEASAADERGTNNYAEVCGIGASLRLLEAVASSLAGRRTVTFRAIVRSDSQWALEASSPTSAWSLKSKEKDGSPKRSTVVALALRKLRARYPRVEYEWVEGHAGEVYNERADELAGRARRAFLAKHNTVKKESST